MFRVYGPYEADYYVESSEIREALTDWDFIGKEREGEEMVNLIAPNSIQGVFIEDNQATIRILENGKSPTFRHSDKTQRVNLSWLSEQFQRKWYRIVHGPTMLQAADIFTKPFVNAEKWNFAMKLLSIRLAKTTPPDAKAAPAAEASSTGEPAASGKSDTQRLIVEICCHPKSKLSTPQENPPKIAPYFNSPKSSTLMMKTIGPIWRPKSTNIRAILQCFG